MSRRLQKRRLRKAEEPGEGEEFEGVMWHGGYDQSITSSAARAPHIAPILLGPLPFARYTFSRGKEGREKEDDERRENTGEESRMMHAYKFACRL